MYIMEEKQASMKDYLNRMVEKKKQGESLCAYIYNLKNLRNHTYSIKESLPAFCRLYYAMKANPDIRLLKVLGEIVDGFETASIGEIQKAKSFSTKPVIFGAPAKKDYELEEIVQGDIQFVNIESFHDLRRLQYWAKSAGTCIPVIVRVNLKEDVSDSHLKMAGVPTQFGVDERLIPLLLEELSASPNIVMNGFHFHAMSNNLDAEAHVRFIDLCIKKAIEWRRKYQISVSVVNVGGGVGINYFNPEAPFEWDKLSQGLHLLYEQYGNEGIEVILEMGRYLVAECGFYVAEVLDIKMNHGEYFALLRGGSHHFRLPAAWKMNHPFTIHPVKKWDYPFERPMVADKKVSVAGELCTPNDILARNVPMKELKAGDLLVFHFAGAYGWTISHRDFLTHPYPDVYYCE